jgi:hypothetical protein
MNPYQQNISKKDLSQQLLIGLKKHLLLGQDTTLKKETRLQSLSNIIEVLEYVVGDVNDQLPAEEKAILERFFGLLIIKTKSAIICIHSQPESFHEEIAFINVLLKL